MNGEQVPNNELMVYKAVALTRLVRPDANIPATTALATINKKNGRELGLQRGANVFMPNLTPLKYRRLYEIYPDKAALRKPAMLAMAVWGFVLKELAGTLAAVQAGGVIAR